MALFGFSPNAVAVPKSGYNKPRVCLQEFVLGTVTVLGLNLRHTVLLFLFRSFPNEVAHRPLFLGWYKVGLWLSRLGSLVAHAVTCLASELLSYAHHAPQKSIILIQIYIHTYIHICIYGAKQPRFGPAFDFVVWFWASYSL